MPNLKADDILISYELDTIDSPTFIVCAKDGERLIVLRVISGTNGAVSINKLISDYLMSEELR